MSTIDLKGTLLGLLPGKGLAARLSELFFLWSDRIRQRKALRRLDDHLLRDLGVGRAEVEAEADKPFWRA